MCHFKKMLYFTN